MFQRRRPLTPRQNLRELLWPSMGWGRVIKYMLRRIMRLSDSPARIARGLALGGSLSFSPIVGTHILQALAVSYVMRANYLGAAIGTIIGNPWTFPFMWYASYKLGVLIFALFGMEVAVNLPEGITFWVAVDMALHQPFELFVPWMVGGYVLAALTWPVFFVVFLILIKRLKYFQHIRRLKRVHKVAKEITGQDS
jgi:uncharacterized protein (DUF2062 family)